MRVGDLVHCKCGKIATHHHRGRHYCEEHARVHASNCRRSCNFWYTPEGAKVEVDVFSEKPLGIGTTFRFKDQAAGQNKDNKNKSTEFVEYKIRDKKKFDQIQIIEGSDKRTKVTASTENDYPYSLFGARALTPCGKFQCIRKLVLFS